MKSIVNIKPPLIDGAHGRVMLKMHSCGCWTNLRQRRTHRCYAHETLRPPGWDPVLMEGGRRITDMFIRGKGRLHFDKQGYVASG